MEVELFDINKITEQFINSKVATKELITAIIEKSKDKGCIVFAPHPDDEIIGCGGTLFKLRQQGIQCKIVYTTYTERSFRGQEALNSAAQLNIGEVEFLGFEDGNVNNQLDYVINEILQNNQFGVVFIPSIFEVHKDHIAVTNAVNNFFKKNQRDCIIVSYEVWCPQLSNGICSIEELSYTKKLNALKEYKSQIKHYQLDVLCEFLNKRRFEGTGIHCAEVFYLCDSKMLHRIITMASRVKQNIGGDT